MAENKHSKYDLSQMQSLPLEAKISMSKRRIRDWYEYWNGDVCVSFSGGKDSTVLKHLVDSVYDDVPSVFVDTGLEYPEIRKFVKEVKEGKYDCFNSDVEIIRPEMRFDEVIREYGYPIIGKEVSMSIRYAKNGATWAINNLDGRRKDGTPDYFKGTMYGKYRFLLDAPFKVSNQCCEVMKEKPAALYQKRTGRKPFIGIMASESRRRMNAWIQTGCNAYEEKRKRSTPLAFWTEQDVLHYIKKYNVPYCSVYGDIVEQKDEATPKEQQSLFDYMYYDGTKLETTGCDRTGCMFCGFGCHLEKEPNRFQRMKVTHPKQWDYCINTLGMGKVLDYIGVKYE